MAIVLTPPSARVPSTLTGPAPDDDEPALLLESEEDVPRRTLDLLGQGRDALVALVGNVFQAVEAIVEALLRLVQAVAGQDAAETLDQGAARALAPLIPDADEPAGSTEEPSRPGDDGPTTGPSLESPLSLHDRVRGVLLTHAASETEREAVSPALVDMVTSGVQFMLSVERRFPGAIDALQVADGPAAEEPDPAPASAPHPVAFEDAAAPDGGR